MGRPIFGHFDTVNPSVNDDAAAGFPVGTNWFNNTTETWFKSVDATTGAARWESITERTLITYSFEQLGALPTGVKIDGQRLVLEDAIIEKIYAIREEDGTSSSTIVDVNLDTGSGPVTIFTDQDNRLTILSTDGDDFLYLSSASANPLPDIVAISEGDLLTVDIDSVENGGGGAAPMNIRIVVVAR